MGYTQAQAIEFINTIGPLIQEEAKKRSYIVCSTVIAQAIIESAANTSSLGYKYANYFGMKCGSKWTGGSVSLKTKEEYKPGTLTTIKDNFRTYLDANGNPDMAAGVKGYYDFISAKRYENLRTAANYKQYAEMLKADGYATSSSYISTLCKTVEKYSLQRYDNAIIPTYIKTRRTLHRGMSGSDVALIQTILHNNRYNIGKCGADGIFGADTEKALKEFQNEKGLVVDGLCGPKTWIMLEKYN